MTVPFAAVSPFTGDILVCAPHMDDDALGCGMLIALHAGRGRVHVLFTSDGALSPAPPRDEPQAAKDLPAVREAEALAGLEVLGVSSANVGFMRLPDGSLAHHEGAIERQIRERASVVRASTVLVPFRYDRHPDHIAVNRAATAARRDGMAAELFEYFVYTKWRMLATGDVRDYVRGDDLVRVHTMESARLKRAALDRHRSQTTLYFRGQRRPILTRLLLDEACAEPEAFLRHRPELDGRRALARGQYWVPIACKLEPALKRLKDRLAGERVQ